MTARDRQDSRRAGVNRRAGIARTDLEMLISWHERRAKTQRINAGQETDTISTATLLGNADTHDVAASVLRRVLEGKPLEAA